MSERCTVIQLRNGALVYAQDPIAEILAAVQDPGGAPLLELTASEIRGGKTIWIRGSEIATLHEAELFTDEERAVAVQRDLKRALGQSEAIS